MSRFQVYFWRVMFFLAAMMPWAWAMTGCSSFPPASVSAGFFGANVTVATPGWSAPVPVVESHAITKPTLLVPPDSPVASEAVATIQPTATLNPTVVEVVVAPVATETLAVPAK